ncbi:MAG: ECF transporter S component [Oscillospiraceae bacterium]|nr:MAG: ECF transporter S component [Oscillospiraceae bacterium]
MIENALRSRQVSFKLGITVKALISAGIVALAVLLPQLAHLALGEQAGMRFLPMYLPVLLGGCLLGWQWGLGIGLLSPLVSYLITAAAGAPMPALARLPFMMAELAVFAVVCGVFSDKIARNGLMAFPAVLLAQLGGRSVFLLSAAAFSGVSPLNAAMVWSQIQTGFAGLLIQAVLAPVIIIGLKALMDKSGSGK